MKRALPLCCAAILALAIIASGAAWADPSRERDGERESPPERISIERLEELAAQAAHQTPLGSIARHAALGTTTTLTWAPLGPAPIADDYWSMGQASGRVSAMVVDPRDANVVYLAAAQGGVWKTTDGGDSWSPLTDELSSLASGALALDPDQPRRRVLRHRRDAPLGRQLLRRRRLPQHRRRRHAGPRSRPATHVGELHRAHRRARVQPARAVRSPATAASCAAPTAARRGCTSSTSANWCFDLAVDPDGQHDRVRRSSPATASTSPRRRRELRSQLAGGLPVPADSSASTSRIAPSAPNTLYASFVTGRRPLFGMYRTLDGGDDLVAAGVHAELPRRAGLVRQRGDRGSHRTPTCASPAACIRTSAGNTGVIRTTDGGASWTDVTFGVDGMPSIPDQHILAFGPDGALWLGNDGGVWKTTDAGEHWQQPQHEPRDHAVLHRGAAPRPIRTRILGGTQDNGTVHFEGVDAVAASRSAATVGRLLFAAGTTRHLLHDLRVSGPGVLVEYERRLSGTRSPDPGARRTIAPTGVRGRSSATQHARRRSPEPIACGARTNGARAGTAIAAT